MDVQLTVIIGIFVLLFILEKYESFKNGDSLVPLTEKKEGFTAADYPGFMNWSPHLEPGYYQVPYSINYGDQPRNFGNFGTFGSYPPDPLCASCHLEGDCATAPYLNVNNVGDQSGEQHGRVCRPCRTLTGKNYANLNKPLLVDARSNGRPRQCRRLI